MAKRKDPVEELKTKDKLPGLDALDDEMSDLNFDAEFPDIDSNSDREPTNEQKGIGSKLKAGALLVAGGASSTITAKIKEAFPETGKLANEALNVASDFSRMKYEFTKDIDPIINQTKGVAKRISSKLADSGVIPKSINDKLQDALKTEDYGGSDISKEDIQQASIGESLKQVFKAQNVKDDYKRREDRVDKFLDRKTTMVQFRDTSNILQDIRMSTLHIAGFLGGPYTGYLKKALELKYKHYFVAQDTLEIMRIHAQNTEGKLEAIRHNTALPDIQKEHATETFAALSKTAMMTKMQDYMGSFGKKVLGNIKDNFIDPTKDFASMMGDLLEGAEMALDMDSDIAEMEGRKPKGIAGHAGSAAGKMAGWVLGKHTAKNLLDKHLGPYADGIENFSATAKAKMVWGANSIKKHGKGEGVLEDGGVVQSLIQTLMPEMDTSLGGSENIYLKDAAKQTVFDIATRQSIVEIIPGFLGKILQQVTHLATGEKAEEMVFDPHKRDFIRAGRFQAETIDRLFGDKETRTRAISGGIESLRTSYLGKATSLDRTQKTVQFDEINDQIAKFIFNMGQQKEYFSGWPNEIKTIVDNDGKLDGVPDYFKDYFRGIKDVHTVAKVLYSSLFRDDGSIDTFAVGRYEKAMFAYTLDFMDRHKDKMAKVVDDFGHSRHLKEVFTPDEYGNIMVNVDKARDRATDLDKDIIREGDTSSRALEEYKRMEGEKKKSNSILKILLGNQDVKNKLRDTSVELKASLKESIRGTLIKLGIPEEWLDKVLGKKPEELTPYDNEMLESLTAEGINLEHYLDLQWRDQRANFQRMGKKYSERRAERADAISEYANKYGISKDEAAKAIKDDYLKERTREYGPDTLEKSITDTVHSVTDKAKEVVKKAKGTKAGKQVQKTYDDITKEMGAQYKHWASENPEEAAKVESFVKEGDKSIGEIKKYVSKLQASTKKTMAQTQEHVKKVKADYQAKRAAGKSHLEAGTEVAKDEVTAAKQTFDEIKTDVKEKKIPFITKFFHDYKEEITPEIQAWIKKDPKRAKRVEELIAQGQLKKEEVSKYLTDAKAKSEARLSTAKKKITDVKNDVVSPFASNTDDAFAVDRNLGVTQAINETTKFADKTKTKSKKMVNKAINAIDHATKVVKESKQAGGIDIPQVTSIDPTGVPADLEATGKAGWLKNLKTAGAVVGEVFKGLVKEDEGSLNLEPIMKLFGMKTEPHPQDIVKKITDKGTDTTKHTDDIAHTAAHSKVDKTSPDVETQKQMLAYFKKMQKSGTLKATLGEDTDNKVHAVLKGRDKTSDKETGSMLNKILDILREQLMALRDINLNTSESAYNGVLASAISTGDTSILDKIVKRPGVLRRASRAMRGVMDDVHEMSKDAILFGASKSTKFRKGVGAVASTIKDITLSPYTIPTGMAKSAVFNFIDVFRADDLTEPLVSKDKFKNDEFPDKLGLADEDGKPIKSVYEIRGPVYKRSTEPKAKWEEVISQRDIGIGLTDSKGRPIKRMVNKAGRFVRHRAIGAVGLAKKGLEHLAGGSATLVGGLATGTMKSIAGTFNIGKAIADPFPDIYRVGMDLKGKPLVEGNTIEHDGYFVDSKGKPKVKVKSCYDIDKPVKHGTTGKWLISDKDLKIGLITNKGEPLDKVSHKIGRGVMNAFGLLKDAGGLLVGTGGNILQTAWDLGTSGVKRLFEGEDPFQDVYVKGQVHPDKVKVYGNDIRDRKIFFAEDGVVVKSAFDIDKPVMNKKKKILIREEDIKEGLVTVENKPLTHWNSLSIGGKLLRGGASLIAGTVKGIGKGLALAGKGIAAGLGLAGKGLKKGSEFMLWGSALIDDLRGSLINVFGDKREKIMKADLKTIVGDKLDNIYTLLDERLGTTKTLESKPIGQYKKKKATVDKDGDGDRDGSYEDQMQGKKKKKDTKAVNDKSLAGSTVAGMAGAAGKGKDGKDGSSSGIIDALAGHVGGHLTEKYGGKVLGKLAKIPGVSKAGSVLSKVPGLGKLGALAGVAGGAAAAGAAGGSGVVGTVADVAKDALITKGVTTAGSALLNTGVGAAAASGLATAGTAIGGAASAAGAGLGGLATGAGALIASNPVGWAIGGALVIGVGGYLLYKWATSKTNEEKDLADTRFKMYGVGNDKYDLVEKLEKRTFEGQNGKGPLDSSELESWAKDFGCFDKSDVKGSVGYFNTWYQKRFAPIFERYLMGLNVIGIEYKNTGDIKKEQVQPVKDALNGFDVGPYASLVPTLEAYNAVNKKDPQDKDTKKKGEQTELEKEEERKAQEEKAKADEAKGITTGKQAPKWQADFENNAGITTIPSYIPTNPDGTVDKEYILKVNKDRKEAMSGGPAKKIPELASGTGVSETPTGVTPSMGGKANEKPTVPGSKFGIPATPSPLGSVAGGMLAATVVPGLGTSPTTGTPGTAPVSGVPGTPTAPGVAPGSAIPGTDATTRPSVAPKGVPTPSAEQKTPGAPTAPSEPLSTGSYKFGKQTAKMEAGGNPGMVSNGDKWGDPGGVSYGKYQFASKAKIPEKFMSSPEAGKYGEILKAAGPVNSPEFKAKWQELGKDPGFEAAQDSYGKKMYLDDNVKKYPWVANKSPMVQEAVMHAYMGSGNQGKHMMNAIDKAGGDKLSDKEILQLMDKEYKGNIGKTKGFWVGQNKDATFLKKYDEQQKVLLAAQDEYDKNKAAKKEGTPEGVSGSPTGASPTTTPGAEAAKSATTPAGVGSPESQAPSAITPKQVPGEFDTAAKTPGTSKPDTPFTPSGGSFGGAGSSGSFDMKKTPGSSPSIPSSAPGGPGGPPVAGAKPEGTPGSTGPGKPVVDPGAGLSKVKTQSGVDIAGLQSGMKSAVGAANAEFMAKFGRPFLVTSGKRSLEKQQQLFDKYGASRAAKPSPNAPHVKGIAIDVNTPDANKLDESGILGKYGLSRPLWPSGKGKVKPEAWHIQMTGTPPDTTADPTGGKEPSDKELAAKKPTEGATAAAGGAGGVGEGGGASPSGGASDGGTGTGASAGAATPDGSSSSAGGTGAESTPLAGDTSVPSGNIPGFNKFNGDTPAAPTPITSTAAKATAAPTESTNSMLEQTKLMVSLLTNMDKSLTSITGWSLGTKMDSMIQNQSSGNSSGGDTTANSSSGSAAAPGNKPTKNAPSGPTPAEPGADRETDRSTSTPYQAGNPTTPLAVRRGGRPPLQV